MVVSIIMSAYNAGKTIKKAIKSCQNQSLKDFELIIVNDCSTDNTEKIVLKELKKDNRIKYVRNECNLGAGMSRRNGIKHIQGDYSCFLDSDDYLEPDYLQTLYDAAIKYDSDLVCTGVIGVYKNKKYKNPVDKVYIFEGMDKYKVFHEAYKYLNGMFIKSSLWDLVEYSDRRFIEDTPTMVKLIWYANRRTYIPYVGYNYVQNNNSLIHTSSKYKDAVYRLLCAKDYVEFFKDKYPKWSTLKLMDRVLNEIVQMKCSNEEYSKYLQILVDCINFYNKEIEERNK